MSAPDSRGRFHAPAVRAQAERLGVDLGTVDGTGVGGRVTVENVLAARRTTPPSAGPLPATARPHARAQAAHARALEVRAKEDALYLDLFGQPPPQPQAPLRPIAAARARPIIRASVFNSAVEVTIDAAGLNPVLEDVAQTHPSYAMAIQQGPAPTMFNSGDLPPFTSSGLDPQVLLDLPWEVRHYAAECESRAEVFNLVEMYAEDPTVIDGQHTTAGTENFLNRMTAWLVGPDRTGEVYLDDDAAS